MLGTGTSLWYRLGLTVLLLVMLTTAARADVIISQYYEGAGDDKWIEICNTGATAVDLGTLQYNLSRYANAAREDWKSDTTSSFNLALSGTLDPGQTNLYQNSNASLPSYATGTVTNTVCDFNGDDSIVLWTGLTFATANVVDVIGLTGNQLPDTSIVRDSAITTGTTSDYDPADWSVHTNLDDVNNASPGSNVYLGEHTVGGGPGTTTLTVSDNQAADSSGNRPLDEVLIGQYTLSASGGTVILDSVDVTFWGANGPDETDVYWVKVYTTYPGSPIDQWYFDNGPTTTMYLGSLAVTPGTDVDLYFTYELDGYASDGDYSIDLEEPTVAGVTVTSATGSFPIRGATASVLPEVSFFGNGLANRAILPGDTDVVVMDFSIRTNSVHITAFESLELVPAGSGDDAADITNVALYCDENNDGAVDAGDTLLDSFTYDTDNTAKSLSFFKYINSLTSYRFLVAYDFAGTLTSGATYTVSSDTPGFIAPGNTVYWSLTTPLLVGVTLSYFSSPTLVASAGTASDQTVPANASDVVTACIVLNLSSGTADLTTVTLSDAGTGDPDAAIAEVALVQDDGTGKFDTGDTVVTTGTFSGGSLSLVASSVAITSGNDERFFIVYDFNGSATQGQTFIATVAGITASVTVNGPPVTGATLDIDTSALMFPAPTPPGGKVGQPYSYPFQASGGVAAYHWDIVDPTEAPDGLQLNTTSGLFSGTPAAAGTFTFTVRVSDGTQQISHMVTVTISRQTSSSDNGCCGTTGAPQPGQILLWVLLLALTGILIAWRERRA